MNNLQCANLAGDDRQRLLEKREAEDLRELLQLGCWWEVVEGQIVWAFAREPEWFEVTDATAGAVVTVSARVIGRRLTVHREMWRRKDGAPLDGCADSFAIGAMLRRDELEAAGSAPCSICPPAVGLKLRLELEASEASDRVTTMERVKQ